MGAICSSLAVSTSLIATFASHTPPPAVRRPFKLYSTTSARYVWVAPGASRHAILACDHNDSIHYFRYTPDDVVVSSHWGKSMTVSEKQIVFDEIKQWYYRVSTRHLMSNMSFAEDALAWDLSIN